MWAFIRKSVGAKMALVTSGALLFVTSLFFYIFSRFDSALLTHFGLGEIIVILFLMTLFTEIVLVMLTNFLFVGRPLQKLTHTMRDAEGGNFLVRAPVPSDDELGELATCFNSMLAKITDLDARKIDTERALIAAQHDLKYKAALAEKAHEAEEANAKLAQSLADLSLLYQMTQALGKTLELSELIHQVTPILTQTLKLTEFTLLFYNPTREYLEVMAAHGFEDNKKVVGLKFNPGEGLTGLAALEGKPIYVRDTSLDSRYLHYKGAKKEDGSFVSIPLLASGVVVGALNVNRSNKDGFSTGDLQLLESVAAQIAMVCERAQLYMKVKELSVTDELTGIYNRRHFQQVLRMEWKRANRFSRPLSLLVIDVDFFKTYNDTFGHLKGDAALKNLTKIIAENVREVDTIARFGGEEFVVILPDTGMEDALTVAEKIRHLIEQKTERSFERGGTERKITVSIGVAAYPHVKESEEELINRADLALYQAKGAGRNRIAADEPQARLAVAHH